MIPKHSLSVVPFAYFILALTASLIAADLSPTSFVAPSNGVGGGQIEVSWVVTNRDSAIALPSWTDTIYLSSDQVLDVLDSPIASFTRSLPCAANGSYVQAGVVTLPAAQPGSWFLILKVDSAGTLSETNEANNQLAVAFTLNAPDLTVTNLAAPASATLGQQIQVQWTIRNLGSGEAQPNWTDTLYISTDPVLDGSDAVLGSFTRTTKLPAGQSYLQSQTITLPSAAPGNYYLIMRTDSGNSVAEPNEANNQASVAIFLGLPDLVVTSISNAPAVSTRQRVEVNWSVRNLAPVPAKGSWTDQIYLPTDPQWDVTDLSLGTASRSSTVASSNSYVVSLTAQMPAVPPGQYYLIVRADNGNSLRESNETNNDRVVSVRIDAPNLTPTALQFSRTVLRGRTIPISWTVRNPGSGNAAPNWTDQIYFSTDDVWDPQDQSIGQFTRDAALGPGAEYSQFQSVTLPATNAGNYFLILRVDSGNALYESNEADNDLASPITLAVADLAPVGLAAPAKAAFGQPLPITWTVTNQGPVDALPNWVDRLYVSGDATLDAEDQPLGADYTRTLALGPGQSYERSISVTFNPGVPAVIAGTNLSPFANPAAVGTITREFWTNVSGRLVRDFNFQGTASSTQALVRFEAPRDVGDQYAARIRGFVNPPKTGMYAF